MFHNTHLYFAKKLYKSDDPLLLVGSFLPDLAVTKIIKWDGGLHGIESDDKFHQFIKDQFPEYLSLAQGIHAHNILDDFTHTKYISEPGYAFQNNKKITKMVCNYYGLVRDTARGKAHNYIESAVDIQLLQEHLTVQEELRNAVSKIDEERLALILERYFKVDKKEILVALVSFFDLFTKYDFSRKEDWVMFWADLEKLLDLKDIGEEKRRELLDQSMSITADTYSGFLKYSLLEGAKNI